MLRNIFSKLVLEEEKTKGFINDEYITLNNETMSIGIYRTTSQYVDTIKKIKDVVEKAHDYQPTLTEKYNQSHLSSFIVINNNLSLPLIIEKREEFISTTELISKSHKLDEAKMYEAALKPLLKKTIELYSLKDFNQIDSIIEKFIQKDFSIKSTIGLLMVTHKIRSELMYWDKLIHYTKRCAYNADYTSDRIANLVSRFS